MKNFFTMIPHDVKKALLSLTVSVALICGSLFVLSAYIGSIAEKESVEVVAPPPIEESVESSAT